MNARLGQIECGRSIVPSVLEGHALIKISGSYLYQVGAELRPLQNISDDWTKGQVYGRLWSCETWLDTLMNKSVYTLHTSAPAGNELLATLRQIRDEYSKPEVNFAEKVDWWDQHRITTQGKTFETVLLAELQFGQLYLVQQKGGYDLTQLTENGIVIFPTGMAEKVPEAIDDAKQAARCIAFDLPTAAAFHLHRLQELIMRRYYDTVTCGKARPEKRNIGSYIDALKGHGFKDQKVLSALAGLKNFHRNPVLHPDDKLENIDEALALLGNIYTVVTYMLKALPPEPLKLTPPPSNDETKAIEDKTAQA